MAIDLAGSADLPRLAAPRKMQDLIFGVKTNGPAGFSVRSRPSARLKRSEAGCLCYVVSWPSDQQRQLSSSSALTMAGLCESGLTT